MKAGAKRSTHWPRCCRGRSPSCPSPAQTCWQWSNRRSWAMCLTEFGRGGRNLQRKGTTTHARQALPTQEADSVLEAQTGVVRGLQSRARKPGERSDVSKGGGLGLWGIKGAGRACGLRGEKLHQVQRAPKVCTGARFAAHALQLTAWPRSFLGNAVVQTLSTVSTASGEALSDGGYQLRGSKGCEQRVQGAFRGHGSGACRASASAKTESALGASCSAARCTRSLTGLDEC